MKRIIYMNRFRSLLIALVVGLGFSAHADYYSTGIFTNNSNSAVSLGVFDIWGEWPNEVFVTNIISDYLPPGQSYQGMIWKSQLTPADTWLYRQPLGGPWKEVVPGHYFNENFTLTNDLSETHADPDEDENAKTEEPINVIDGAVTHEETDLLLPCPGLSLSLRRYYKSTLDYNGAIGHRWIHSYESHLSATNLVEEGVTNDYQVLLTGQGRQYWFKQNEDGSFVAPFDNDYALATNGTDYILSMPGGIQQQFDSNGVLTQISDIWNNSLSLTYQNDYPTQQLTRVEHNNGKYFDFAYSNGLLASVEISSSNLSMEYFYNGEGELTNAVRTATSLSQSRQYAYDYSASGCNHSLTEYVDAAGYSYAYSYLTNADGTATSWGTNMVLESDYYRHTVDFSTSNQYYSTVTYSRGDTNLWFQHYYSAVQKRVEAIYGPNTTNTGSYFEHDSNGNETAVIRFDDDIGESTRTERLFDSHHNCTNESFGYCADPENVWSYSWDTNWNVLTGTTDPEGYKTEIEYTNALPSKTKLYYTSGDYWETLMGYTSDGLLSGVTNANGHWVNFNHDSYGNVTSAVPQVGPTVRSTYTSLGHLQTIQMPPYAFFPDTSDPGSTNGIWMYRVTSNTVNELGWISKTTYPHPDTGGTNGPSEYFYRDAIGNITNHVDIAGRSTKYTWLPTRKLSSVARTLNGTNVSTSLTYDNQFNTLVIQDPLGRSVESYARDLQDRPVTITNLEGQTMTVDYGVGDYVRSISRFDGTTVSNAYNVDGWVSEAYFPDATISMTYLKNGLLSTIDNSLGMVSNSWTFANRLSSQTQIAPSGTVSYAQDPVGNVTGMTSVAGTQVSTFDEGERVSSIQSESFFQFAYNTNNGLLSSVVCTNSGIGVNYTMDAWDRVKSITWTNNSGETLRSFTCAYNSTGVISSVTHEDGSVVVYGYDGIDRLVGETQMDAQGNTNLDVSLTYDLAGNRTSKTRAGVEIAYALGDGNRFSGWSTVDTNFSVTLDVSGYADEDIGTGARYGQLWVSNSLGTMTPYVNGEYFYAFGMLSALGTQEIVAAICDIAGNTTYATSSVCMSVVTNGSYQYNEAGCVTSIVYTGIAYSRNLGLSWNSQYQLTSASTNGTEVESYGYDALGRRVYVAQGTSTNWLVYDGVQVVAEVNGSGQLQKSYTWGTGIDNLLAMTVYSGGTGTTYYALTDHLGTVHALADSSGSIVESYRFDAWGRVLGVYDSSNQPIAESAIGNRYLWQGREYSWKTGLYFFRARWYDPITGRWLSNDPIGISGGLNQYVFCGNNPVMARDPLGLCTGGDDSENAYLFSGDYKRFRLLQAGGNLEDLKRYYRNQRRKQNARNWTVVTPFLAVTAYSGTGILGTAARAQLVGMGATEAVGFGTVKAILVRYLAIPAAGALSYLQQAWDWVQTRPEVVGQAIQSASTIMDVRDLYEGVGALFDEKSSQPANSPDQP